MRKKKEKHKNGALELMFGIIEPILFVLMTFIATQILKGFTLESAGSIQGIFLDLLILTIIAILSLLIHPKARTILLTIIFICICCGCIYENAYYNVYSTFSGVMYNGYDITFLTFFEEDTIILTLLYIFMIFIYFIYSITSFIILICAKKKGMTVNIRVPIISLVCLVLFQIPIFLSFNDNDWSKLRKLWNKEYVLDKYGVVTYWINNVYQSRTLIIKGVSE